MIEGELADKRENEENEENDKEIVQEILDYSSGVDSDNDLDLLVEK